MILDDVKVKNQVMQFEGMITRKLRTIKLRLLQYTNDKLHMSLRNGIPHVTQDYF